MQKSIWPLVFLHHVGAIGMAVIALSMGDDCPRELGCRLLISLLGTTGLFHLLMLPITNTPIFNIKPLFLVCQTITVSSMLWFRAIYWWKLVYEMVVIAWAIDWVTFGICAAALLLFTAFNFDFCTYHIKLLKAAYVGERGER